MPYPSTESPAMKRYLFFLALPLTLSIQTHAQWALLQFTDKAADRGNKKTSYHFIRVDQHLRRWIAYLDWKQIELSDMTCAWGKKSPETEEISWEPLKGDDLDKVFKDVVKSLDKLHPQTLFDRKKLEQLNEATKQTIIDFVTQERNKKLFPWYKFDDLEMGDMWVLDEKGHAVSLFEFAKEERDKLPQPVDFFSQRPRAVQKPQAPPVSQESADGGSNNATKYIIISAISVVGLSALLFKSSGRRAPRSAAYGFTYSKERSF